jgi:hypothetical protein
MNSLQVYPSLPLFQSFLYARMTKAKYSAYMPYSTTPPTWVALTSVLEQLAVVRSPAYGYPYVQQFDNVDELFDILNALKLNVDLNTEIRQQMRRETLRLAAHNAGKWQLD